MHRFSAVVLFVLLVWSAAVSSVPTFNGRSTMSSLVSGLSSLQAIRAGQGRKSVPRYLNVRSGPNVGNLSITTEGERMPLFYVHRSRLWQYVNETTVYAVNLVNTTQDAPGTSSIPLQLVLDTKPGGISAGTWRWKGTMLFYELGDNHNSGVYYDCLMPQGGHGMITFLEAVPTPRGCGLLTLHAFEHDI